MDYQGKRVLVVGAGISGIDACHFLLKQGASVILMDSKSRENLNQDVLDLEKKGVELRLGNLLPQQVDWELVVSSPGVPLGLPVFSLSREAGVEVIGEIELAWRNASRPFIGITGTNGKTTTTALTAYLLEQQPYEILLGGNIGQPLVSSIGSFAGDYIVAELSSFQLESCRDFHPHIAAFLNLSPDHLDRHGSLENYGAAKARIFARQEKDDFAILNWDDPYLRQLSASLNGQLRFFSLQQPVEDGMFFQDGRVFFVRSGRKVYDFPAADIYIKGRHNIANAMAGSIAACEAGMPPERIHEGLQSFPGVPHRLEFVCERDGVCYVNDSKGTNPDSTTQALLAYEQPMIVLLGGRNKGCDMRPLLQLVKERARSAVLFGEATAELKRAADAVGFKSYQIADDFTHAVFLARSAALPGDVVLLSPACTSWDAFPNFEVRGDLFKKLVRE
ncbi:MAG: UDP-N-acetylmuramoyl-L-alanine--D-glutamate ligase [Bacillota bacterium]|nr:UDP-N-acetylmuramoyl-L-alanine--D-glutamate ligase [Bacillota bacterium]